MKKTNTIIGDKYEEFLEYLADAVEDDALPIMMEHSNPDKIKLKDIREFCIELKRDTGLEAHFHMWVCDCCGVLHAGMEIGYPEEDSEPQYLQ